MRDQRIERVKAKLKKKAKELQVILKTRKDAKQ